MKYRKTMPILEEGKRKNTQRHGEGHRRVSIPYEIREHIKLNKGDLIEWEVDTDKNIYTKRDL
jgi:antitoxin component of MazEF toxin-antitoxin module